MHVCVYPCGCVYLCVPVSVYVRVHDRQSCRPEMASENMQLNLLGLALLLLKLRRG